MGITAFRWDRKTRYPAELGNTNQLTAGGQYLYLSPFWFSVVMELISMFDNEDLWVGEPNQVLYAIQNVRDLLAQDMIPEEITNVDDVRINNGRLEALINGDWYDRGAIEGTPGEQGEPGQNAPIPEISFFDNGAVIYLRVDVDGDGVHDYQSPNIKGAQGAQGIQGIQGTQGIQGIQGEQGEQGEPGIQGIQGEPGENAPLPIFQFRSVGNNVFLDIDNDADGDYEYSSPNIRGIQGATGETGATGATGANGAVGITDVLAIGLSHTDAPTAMLDGSVLTLGIPAGSPGTGSGSTFPTTLPDNTNNHICSGVGGAVAGMWEAWNYFLDEVDLYRQGIKTTSSFVSAVTEFLDSVYVPFVGSVDALITLANDIGNLGLATVSVQTNDPAEISNHKENLYCRIIGEASKQFTEQIWDEWLEQDVSEIGSPYADLLIGFFRDNVSFKKVQSWYFIDGLDESNTCEVYGCNPPITWEQVFDFKTAQSLHGFTQYSAGRPVPFVDTYGMTAANNAVGDATEKIVSAKKLMQYADATTRLTSVKIEWENVSTGNGTLSGFPVNRIYSATPTISFNNGDPANAAQSGATGNRTADFDETKVVVSNEEIRVFMHLGGRTASPAFSGTGSISNLTVYGTGKNPFVV